MASDLYDISGYGYSYADLPMEIIVKIFSYLHPMDRMMASTVCHRWLEATQHPTFLHDFALNFHQVSFTEELSPLADFLQSFRQFSCITLNQVEFGESAKFWHLFGEGIHEVVLKACDIREKGLTAILRAIPNLCSLRIEACRTLFMPGRLFESEESRATLKEALENVSCFSLAHNRYLSDALFSRLVHLIPNLEQLDLSGCHISFHKGLYRKFYPESHLEPSECVLTFLYISQYIRQRAEHLKTLNFSTTLIDGTALETLAEIEGLQLRCIHLKGCDQLTNPGIIKLVKSQQSLQYLDLSMSSRITDQSLMEICETLPNLKSLKLRKCRALTDAGVKNLVKLRHVEVLDISECDTLTGAAILEGIGSEKNPHLQELYVSALNICEASILRIAESFPNLLVLDLSFCINSVTDLCLQSIFKNLIWLRHLNLELCDKISDAAMTGADLSELFDDTESLSSFSSCSAPSTSSGYSTSPTSNLTPMDALKRFVENKEHQHFKISLGSKAEGEIRKDALRKKAMQEMCEQSLLTATSNGYSIARLRGLRVLKLTGCNRLSDVSLKYSFKFKELKEISLAKCQQISIVGIEELVKNCPSLEVVDLSECHNINDKSVGLITENLHRLTTLTLERCFQLTDHSLDYIAINCKMLKNFDVRGCRSMCAEPNLRVANVRSLRNVQISKPGPYVSQNFEPVKKPKPPPFPKFRS